jgi:hypothetical protein
LAAARAAAFMRIIFGFLAALCALAAFSDVAGGQQPEGPFFEVLAGVFLYLIALLFASAV